MNILNREVASNYIYFGWEPRALAPDLTKFVLKMANRKNT